MCASSSLQANHTPESVFVELCEQLLQMILRIRHEAQGQQENFQNSRGVSYSFHAHDFVFDSL